MRVTAKVDPDRLATIFHDGISDRYVESAVFVPIDVPLTALNELYSKISLATSRAFWIEYLQYPHRPSSSANHFHRAVASAVVQQLQTLGLAQTFPDLFLEAMSHVPPIKQQTDTTSAPPGPPQTRDTFYSRPEAAFVAEFSREMEQTDSTAALTKIISGKIAEPIFVQIVAKIETFFKGHHTNASHTRTVGMLPKELPFGVPRFTSELGFLFLERTRIRPAGFQVGEHLYTLSLAPGEEVTLEQKSYRKDTSTFEQELEREFERKMESETSRRLETVDTENDQLTTQSDSHFGETGSVGFMSPKVPVSAEIGADLASDFATASTVAETRSITLAGESTERTSSRLRSTHRTSFKLSSELSLEQSSRRVIRNPNETTPIDLHYFKIMQNLSLQLERRGARLCWAPFIPQPGALVRQRIAEAKLAIEGAALNRLQRPTPPSQPNQQMLIQWCAGSPEIVYNQGFSIVEKTVTLTAPKPQGDTAQFTGRVRIKKRGPAAYRTSAVMNEYATDAGVNSNDDYVYEGLEISDDHFVTKSVDVTVAPITNIAELATMQYAEVWLEVEVLRGAPGFGEEVQRYEAMKLEWESEVKTLETAAIAEVAPQISAVQDQILAELDPRAELLGRVINYIKPEARDEGKEVALWHRIIDFPNVSYDLYPGWWAGPLPYPDLPASHLLNASWARVYLPARYIPSQIISKSNEAQLLHQLYQPNWYDGADFNRVVEQLVKDLSEAQAKYYENGQPMPRSMGDEWGAQIPTDGTHIEVVLSATTAADARTERQYNAVAQLQEQQALAVEAENQLRSRVGDPVTGQVIVGHDAD